MSSDDREFEPVLRTAMLARPQPASISNLAYRAMERAREDIRLAAAEQWRALCRLRRRSRWVGVVATLLIAAVIAIGAKKLTDGGLSSLSVPAAATTTTDSTSSEDATAAGSSSVTLGVVVTAELLVVAMILLSAGAASSRPIHGDPILY